MRVSYHDLIRIPRNLFAASEFTCLFVVVCVWFLLFSLAFFISAVITRLQVVSKNL